MERPNYSRTKGLQNINSLELSDCLAVKGNKAVADA
jgi:hypothetical protein